MENLFTMSKRMVVLGALFFLFSCGFWLSQRTMIFFSVFSTFSHFVQIINPLIIPILFHFFKRFFYLLSSLPYFFSILFFIFLFFSFFSLFISARHLYLPFFSQFRINWIYITAHGSLLHLLLCMFPSFCSHIKQFLIFFLIFY